MSVIGKPIVNTNSVFDVYKLNDFKINFKWNGQKASGNRLTVTSLNGTSKTHDIVGISSAFHPITYDVCKQLGINNGHTYKATITMLDYDGTAISNPSEQFMIYAYSTPTFEIRDIADTIKSSTFMAMINYESQEGMQLQSYKFNLYKSGVLVDSSPELYILPDKNTTDYSVCSYVFNLENESEYIIEAVGVTVYGMNLSVSYDIKVAMGNIKFPNIVEATSTRDGNVNVSVKCIPMKYEMGNISYTENNEIDLNNGYVNYKLAEPLGNFKVKVKLRDIKDLSKEILSFKDYTDTNINIVSIKPKVEYIHSTTATTTSTDGLIRPTLFTYDGNNYIDYIESARMRLCLYINKGEYTISNESYIILSYDSNTDKFYLDENKNIILEITKINGNFNITTTTI